MNKLNSNGSTASQNGNSTVAVNNLPPPECLFTIEFHSGSIAFRDLKGQYLAGTGHASILKTRSTTVSKDELFEFHKAPLQVCNARN